jgi:tetratricopeptide (TPR) repeat protein
MARSLYFLGKDQVFANVPDGEANLRRALEIVGSAPKPEEELHLWIVNDLGLALSRKGDRAGAIEQFRNALAIRERIYPENHLERAIGMGNLGNELVLAGRTREARPYLENALAASEKALRRPDHPLVAIAAQCLGELDRLEGRLDHARVLLERATAIFETQVALWGSPRDVPNGFNYSEILRSLGLVDEAQGRVVEALQHLGESRDVFLLFPGPGNLDPSQDYARVLRKAGRVAEAEKIEASIKTEPGKK